jgi:Flp pilus assembly pilin Flp
MREGEAAYIASHLFVIASRSGRAARGVSPWLGCFNKGEQNENLIARFTGPREYMDQLCRYICSDEQGQDIAEYAVMLAVILVLVIGTARLIGGNANNAFSSVANSLSQ